MNENDSNSKLKKHKKNNKPFSSKNGSLILYNNTKTKLDPDSDKLSSKYVNGVIKVQDNNRIIFNTQVK